MGGRGGACGRLPEPSSAVVANVVTSSAFGSQGSVSANATFYVRAVCKLERSASGDDSSASTSSVCSLHAVDGVQAYLRSAGVLRSVPCGAVVIWLA